MKPPPHVPLPIIAIIKLEILAIYDIWRYDFAGPSYSAGPCRTGCTARRQIQYAAIPRGISGWFVPQVVFPLASVIFQLFPKSLFCYIKGRVNQIILF